MYHWSVFQPIRNLLLAVAGLLKQCLKDFVYFTCKSWEGCCLKFLKDNVPSRVLLKFSEVRASNIYFAAVSPLLIFSRSFFKMNLLGLKSTSIPFFDHCFLHCHLLDSSVINYFIFLDTVYFFCVRVFFFL